MYDRLKDKIFGTAKDMSGNRFNLAYLDGYVYSIYPMGYCYKILGEKWLPSLNIAIAECRSPFWSDTFTRFQTIEDSKKWYSFLIDQRGNKMAKDILYTISRKNKDGYTETITYIGDIKNKPKGWKVVSGGKYVPLQSGLHYS